MDYKKKYLKYKIKYLKLNQIKHKKIKGGNLSPKIISLIGLGSVGLFTILGILYKIFKKEDEIETTDLDELMLNKEIVHDKNPLLSELKKKIFESTNPEELKELEDKYFNILYQKKNYKKTRTKELDKQQSADLKERIIYQHNKTGLLLKNNSLNEKRYRKLLKNIQILEEKYEILFDKERERREKLIIDDYSKKLEKIEVDYTKNLEEKANIKTDLKQQLYGNLETEYKNKMKYLNDDMNNLDKKLKLHAVNFYLDYCEKKYLTGKLCIYKKDVLETEKNIVKKYNDKQGKLKDLMETIREHLAELKNNNPNDTDEISHYEYLLDYYNNYNNNNFIEDVQKINQEIIETQIEIEQIFEKNKNENKTKIEHTIKHIENNEIKTIKEDLEEELKEIYEKKIQRIKQDNEERKIKNKQKIDEIKTIKEDLEEELSEVENTHKMKTQERKKIDEYDIHFIRQKLFDRKMKGLEDNTIKRTGLIKDINELNTPIDLLKQEINRLTEEIEQLKQDSVLVLPEINTFMVDIENYSKLLIKKFLTTEERQYYKEENPKLEKKIANWIKTTDVYNKYKDGLPEKEDKIDDSNNPDRTMSLGGKKTSS